MRFSLNCWAGIVNDFVNGPILLKRLNGAKYQDMLRLVVPELLWGVPEHYTHNLHYQHDGEPAHFEHRVRDYLNEQFPQRWTGRGGPAHGLLAVPTATPLGFFER